MEKKFKIVFETLKDIRLDENVLCQKFWKKLVLLKENFNESDCWDLIMENGEWLFNSGALDIQLFKSWFPEDILNEHNIFTKGYHEIIDKHAIGFGDAKIHASNHSKVILFENSHCDAFDSTFVKGFQQSSFSVLECVGEAFQNCKVTAKYQSKVEAWDDTIINAEDYSFVIKHDNCRVTLSKRAYSVSQ